MLEAAVVPWAWPAHEIFTCQAKSLAEQAPMTSTQHETIRVSNV